MKDWCIYRTDHPSGHFYQGKGRTALVLAGKYQGSGVRFNLALMWPGYEASTWSTKVLETFDTEEEAYAAEERLVAHESLANPFCLNMMCGGRKGKYKTPSTLLRRYRVALKRERAEHLKTKRKEREVESRAKAAANKAAASEKARALKAAAAQRVRELKAAAKLSKAGFRYTVLSIPASLPFTNPR